MKHYRYERDLEGSPIGTVRKMTAADAEPLLKSGAVEETDEDVTEDAVADDAPKPSVTTDRNRRAPSVAPDPIAAR